MRGAGDRDRTRTVSLEGMGLQVPSWLVSGKSAACRAFHVPQRMAGRSSGSLLCQGQWPVGCCGSRRPRCPRPLRGASPFCPPPSGTAHRAGQAGRWTTVCALSCGIPIEHDEHSRVLRYPIEHDEHSRALRSVGGTGRSSRAGQHPVRPTTRVAGSRSDVVRSAEDRGPGVLREAAGVGRAPTASAGHPAGSLPPVRTAWTVSSMACTESAAPPSSSSRPACGASAWR
jgi:hypothetical protein